MELEDVRLAFIAEALNQYFDDVQHVMRSSILSTKSVDTRTLYNSISYRVYQNMADGNGNLSFAEWGRFLDMGVTRGHPLGGIAATTGALQNRKSSSPIKARKLYSPVVYGHLNGLISRLAYGFTEATINRIKNTLQPNVHPNSN